MPQKQWWKTLEHKAAQTAYVNILGGVVQLELVRRATIPLLMQRRGHAAPELLASGVLFAIRRRVFILTAAHITESLGRNTLYVEATDRVIEIPRDCYKTPRPKSGSYTDDPVDAAVFPVPNDAGQAMLNRCATLDDLYPVDNAYDVAYAVYGFPLKRSSRTGGKLRTDYRCMTVGGLPIGVYESLERKPDSHILMEKQKRVSTVQGMIQQPATTGMSGCGAWILPAHHGSTLPPKLVGIFIEKAKRSPAFVATTIRVHLQLIAEHNSDFGQDLQDWRDSESVRVFREWLTQRGAAPAIPDGDMPQWFAKKIGARI